MMNCTQTFPADFNRGYIQSFNLMVQHEIGGGVIGQVAYVGTRAIRQTANVDINASGPGGGNAGRALFPQFGRTATINSLTPFNTATYDSVQTQLTRRLSAVPCSACHTRFRRRSITPTTATRG